MTSLVLLVVAGCVSDPVPIDVGSDAFAPDGSARDAGHDARAAIDTGPVDANIADTGNDSALVAVGDAGADAGSDAPAASIAIVTSVDTITVPPTGNVAFGVTLSAMPSANVMVSLSAPSTVILSAPSLTFSPVNWSTPQMVMVTGVADDDTVDGSADITLASTGLSSATVHATIVDGDVQAIVLSTTTEIVVNEGASSTFTARLAFRPAASVHVTIVSSSPTSISATPPSIDFSVVNYATPSTITLSAPRDDNTVGETATITLSAVGISSATQDARVNDTTVLARYGWPTAFTASAAESASIVTAFQVSVTAVGRAIELGAYVPSTTGTVRMALYGDSGNVPAALIASDASPHILSPGSNVIMLATPTSLAVGTYWLVVRVPQDTAFGYGSSSSSMARGCSRSAPITDINAAWPASFGAATCSNQYPINLWVTTASP